MAPIDHFNLRSFDLNLLLAFDALCVERSVTKAAARLRVQQPAMSHALSTLRMLLQDELFVRTGQRMDPTPRARSLAGPIRDLLEGVQRTLFTEAPFEPATAERTFRLGLSDQLEAVLVPGLLARLRAEAPGVRLLARATDRQRVYAMLDEGAIDLAIGYFQPAGPWQRSLELYLETHLALLNPRLLPLPIPLGLDAYLGADHAMVSSRDRLAGYMEEAFAEAGVAPRVVLASPHFLTLAFAAARAPVIATLPSRIAERCAASLGLAASPLPFELAGFPVALLWHGRDDRDTGLAWLRAMIERCGEERATGDGREAEGPVARG